MVSSELKNSVLLGIRILKLRRLITTETGEHLIEALYMEQAVKKPGL